ncbi:hypothetical protein [Methylopila sp. 73B]|uniref:hypothetical protein n=1 Tax=Methylopila sp. 73B TaxID=1120792 RepID=UPI00036A2E6B|nr:hypothetical protein [Methylopila sp. 73B]
MEMRAAILRFLDHDDEGDRLPELTLQVVRHAPAQPVERRGLMERLGGDVRVKVQAEVAERPERLRAGIQPVQ